MKNHNLIRSESGFYCWKQGSLSARSSAYFSHCLHEDAMETASPICYFRLLMFPDLCTSFPCPWFQFANCNQTPPWKCQPWAVVPSLQQLPFWALLPLHSAGCVLDVWLNYQSPLHQTNATKYCYKNCSNYLIYLLCFSEYKWRKP